MGKLIFVSLVIFGPGHYFPTVLESDQKYTYIPIHCPKKAKDRVFVFLKIIVVLVLHFSFLCVLAKQMCVGCKFTQIYMPNTEQLNGTE